MIRLITGLPGSFKTCYVVGEIRKAIAAGRPVYASNLNGVSVPGLMLLENPREWEDLPAGSLLVVDEAQRFWRASRSPDVPPEVHAMETHRHLGIDFLLTTQSPMYMLKHLRDLVGSHTHHLARSKSTAQTWTWDRLHEDPLAPASQEKADGGLYVADKDNFKFYVSTEKDTHKRKIPRKWLFIGAAVLVVGAMFTFLPGQLIKASGGKLTPETGAAAVPAQPTLQGSRSKNVRPASVEDYAAELAPRIDAAPWSAPLYDGRAVVAKPELYCISSEAGRDGNGKWSPAGARCLTEQGTQVNIHPQRAKLMAVLGGVYNPYREPPIKQPQMQQQQPAPVPVPVPVVGPSLPASSTPYGTAAAYGALGVGDSPR